MLGLTIDPGISTGICLFSWGEEQAFAVEQVWQIPQGAVGIGKFIDWTKLRMSGPAMMMDTRPLDALIIERFTPRPHQSFALTRLSVESLRGEGAFTSRGFEDHIEWAEPSQQYFIGSPELELSEKKKKSREFLKLHGMYVTGSQVGAKDADDVISATLHSIAWLRRERHMPTMRALFGEGS